MIVCPNLVILLLVVAVCAQHTKGDNDEEVVRFTVDPAGATAHHTAKLVLRVTPFFVFVITFVCLCIKIRAKSSAYFPIQLSEAPER